MTPSSHHIIIYKILNFTPPIIHLPGNGTPGISSKELLKRLEKNISGKLLGFYNNSVNKLALMYGIYAYWKGVTIKTLKK